MGTAEQPPGAGDLDDLDPFDVLDREAARLDRFFDSLDEAGWARPSACAGWSVRDVLGHLAGEELYNHACLNDDVAEAFAQAQRDGAGDSLASFNEWSVRRRRGLPVASVLAEWRQANGETRRRMRERGRDAPLSTMVGPYPVGAQTFHYASEYATHADDVSAPVGSDEEPGRTGWRARVGRFALAEQGSEVEVTPTEAGFQVRLGEATARLSGPDFVAATVARLPADHPLDPRLRPALACLA